jgi:enterochelin esterase-like enzyme
MQLIPMRVPDTAYVDVGDREGETAAIQGRMLADVTALHDALAARSQRNKFVVSPGAEHSFAAWRLRLPATLEFAFATRR